MDIVSSRISMISLELEITERYIDSNTHIPDAAIVSSTLTRNPTWTPPNQVSYLKWSFMDSFTLRLLPKIDFNDKHDNNTTETARELADIHNFSLKYTL
jgi:hypothetical protein